jgi:hypothetical protein
MLETSSPEERSQVPVVACPRTTIVRRLWMRGLLAATALLAACALIEAASYVCLALQPSGEHVGRWEFRGQCPAPYRNAPYFSDAFLLESMYGGASRNPPGTGIMVPTDVQGRYLNVRDGCRRTTDQPSGLARRVLLFGGSTLFGAEVPDEWTVASCLQRRLNRRDGGRWKVENYGACSMLARQQTERLLQTPLRPGDVVLYYDGANDVYFGIYNGNAAGWRLGDSENGGVRRLSWLQRQLYPLCFRFKDVSATARLLLHRMDSCPPANVADRAKLQQHLDAAEAGYRDALLEAKSVVEAQGGTFVHLLQPTLFSLPQPSTLTVERGVEVSIPRQAEPGRLKRSPYEQSVASNELKALPGLDLAFQVGYPRLRRAMAGAAEQGVVSFDLSDALTSRAGSEEFYLDFCHVNHTANERIAEEIDKRVFPALAGRGER